MKPLRRAALFFFLSALFGNVVPSLFILGNIFFRSSDVYQGLLNIELGSDLRIIQLGVAFIWFLLGVATLIIHRYEANQSGNWNVTSSE
jgi:hypothetical protein